MTDRPWRVEIKNDKGKWQVIATYHNKLRAQLRSISLIGVETQVVKHVEFEAKK